MIDTLLEAVALKRLARAGWRRVGIESPESVAAHTWGVAWLVLLLLPDELDREKALTYAILHDFPEVRTGDVTPHDGLTREAKLQREEQAMTALCEGLPRGADLLAAADAIFFTPLNEPEPRPPVSLRHGNALITVDRGTVRKVDLATLETLGEVAYRPGSDIETLMEFGEWLNRHAYPVKRTKDVLQQAADILIEIEQMDDEDDEDGDNRAPTIFSRDSRTSKHSHSKQ